MSQPLEDPFDDLLTLEDTLYTSAYQLGAQDGARAGRIEGRVFGLEKGFEKFSTLGALHGRAVVWGARIASSKPKPKDEGKVDTVSVTKEDDEQENKQLNNDEANQKHDILPQLPPNPRLQKNIHTLHALTDPLTFSTLNTEDAVADYDDRTKRAAAKAKIIERSINEATFPSTSASPPPSSSTVLGVGEDGGSASPRRTAKRVEGGRSVRLNGEAAAKKKGGGEENMEDFTGSRFLR